MTPYELALFLHIVGALGLFVALAIEWVSWGRLQRSADAASAGIWLGLLGLTRRIGPAALLLLLLPGLYMAATSWGWVGWILVGLATMVLIAAIGGLSTGRLVPGIASAVRTDAGSISMATRERMSDPLLRASVRVRAGLALGVVFVMTTKPDALGAAVAVAVFGVLGLATLLLGGRAGSANDATRAVAAGRAGR